MTRLALPVSLLVLSLAVAMHGVQPAWADTPKRTAICIKPIVGKDWENKRTAWMTAQLAAGRSDFFLDSQLICSW
jgi:hypothetical protein